LTEHQRQITAQPCERLGHGGPCSVVDSDTAFVSPSDCCTTHGESTRWALCYWRNGWTILHFTARSF